jgi:myo-inositol-1(or 4)-monophosphatase
MMMRNGYYRSHPTSRRRGWQWCWLLWLGFGTAALLLLNQASVVSAYWTTAHSASYCSWGTTPTRTLLPGLTGTISRPRSATVVSTTTAREGLLLLPRATAVSFRVWASTNPTAFSTTISDHYGDDDNLHNVPPLSSTSSSSSSSSGSEWRPDWVDKPSWLNKDTASVHSHTEPTEQLVDVEITIPGSNNNNNEPDAEAWRRELTSIDLQRLLATAEQAARAAGEIILQAAMFTAETGLPPEVATYDRMAQVAIQSIIGLRYPTQWFLQGKSAPTPSSMAPAPPPSTTGMASIPPPDPAAVQSAVLQSSATTSDIFWIYDPIDGTTNFAAGLELSAVTMAVVYKGTVVVSVILDPYADELFSAVKGQGTFLNKQERLFVNREIDHLEDAIAHVGYPDSLPTTPVPTAALERGTNTFAVALRGVRALNVHCRGVRMTACPALATAWIAAGRLAAHVAYDVNSWDLAAGALLIQEAGGRVTDLFGMPFVLSTRNILCSNGLVHDGILEVLDAADASYVDNRPY